MKKLQLLWKQKLGGAGESLSDPIMLGPIITDRGVKELIFAKDASTVYAVDADLGKVFWSRIIEGDRIGDQRSPANCAHSDQIGPVMKYTSNEASAHPGGDDNYSDGNRPMYVMGAGGRVHVLRPRTGGDLLPPFGLVASPAWPVSLGESDGLVYAVSSATCGGAPDRIWTREAGQSGLAISPHAESKPFIPNKDGETAIGEEGAGKRWIYTGTGDTVAGYLVSSGASKPDTGPLWSLHGLHGCGAPVVANGVVYFLSRSSGSGSHSVLHAVNAHDGEELYTSGAEIAEPSTSGNLALANGHVCFSASNAMLHCFGLPFAM